MIAPTSESCDSSDYSSPSSPSRSQHEDKRTLLAWYKCREGERLNRFLLAFGSTLRDGCQNIMPVSTMRQFQLEMRGMTYRTLCPPFLLLLCCLQYLRRYIVLITYHLLQRLQGNPCPVGCGRFAKRNLRCWRHTYVLVAGTGFRAAAMLSLTCYMLAMACRDCPEISLVLD